MTSSYNVLLLEHFIACEIGLMSMQDSCDRATPHAQLSFRVNKRVLQSVSGCCQTTELETVMLAAYCTFRDMSICQTPICVK